MVNLPKPGALSKTLDSLALHRVTGIPIFLLIMYIMFALAMNIGSALQAGFDLGTQALFIDLPRQWLLQLAAPTWLHIVLVDGIGRGLNVTLTFIPILICIFATLAWLEQSGYIQRAAYVLDKLMQVLGLPGKSFITMVMGFGCNVPAVLSARTIAKQQERILTILMTPFMSCGARLGIYAVFAAAFFQNSAHNVIFALYFTGILMAIFTGLVWRKAILRSVCSACTMELTAYRWPNLSAIWRQTWRRLKSFIIKAGMIIIPFCILIGGAGQYKVGSSGSTTLELLGKAITPIFTPLGITEDNWPASVGLLSGMLAKEVMIGTLDSLYIQEVAASVTPGTANVVAAGAVENAYAKMLRAGAMVKNNLLALRTSLFSNPLEKNLEIKVNDGVLGIICAKFHSQAAAFAYLLFVLLYCPCASVVASISRELNWRWAVFSVFWSTFLAYAVAVGFYQIATFTAHKLSSAMLLLSLVIAFVLVICALNFALNLRKLPSANAGNNAGSNNDNNARYKVVPVPIVFTN